MSSPTDSLHDKPLTAGKYYLVDISEAIDEYMQVPMAVRYEGMPLDTTKTSREVLDLELVNMVPHLNYLCGIPDGLGNLWNNLLEDEIADQREDLEAEGVDPNAVELTNSQLRHDRARAMYDLGSTLSEIFKREGLYDQEKMLVGYHHSLLADGTLVLSERDPDEEE